MVQNSDAFAFTDALLGEGVRYETAGSLQGGKRVWLLAHMPHEYIITGERISPYLLFSNTHDGSGAVKACLTPVRVICNNTLNLALATAKRSWSMVHTGCIEDKLKEAGDTLFMAEKYMDGLGKEFETLRKKKLTDQKVKEYIEILLPMEDGSTPQQARNVKRLREDLAMRYFDAPDLKDIGSNAMFYDEDYPFMLADVDRMVVGENTGLECKTASPYMAKHWEDGRMPVSYQLQCYHYMSVCNADAWYLAVLIYGREFKYYRLERDEAVISDLIRIEEDFWKNHVLAKTLPEPDGSKVGDKVIAAYFQDADAKTIPLTGFDEQLKRRQELIELIERMDKERRQIEQELKIYLGNAEYAENEKYRVSWKNVSSLRVDAERLKAEQPDIYEQYKKPVNSRRFSVKAA